MIKAGLKWMFLIIGTMIGAGYASGRELWQFFGFESGIAIILFTILFSICVYVIMSISYQQKTFDYLMVLKLLMGKKLTSLYDYMIILYLFSTTVIMIAGSGATLEVLNFSYWTGIIIIAILLVLLFIWDTKGITIMNSIIIPILIVFLVGILFSFQLLDGFSIQINFDKQTNWPAAFTFTALNILPLVAVMAGVGHEIRSKGEIWIASVGSGVVLGAVSFLYNESLIKVAHDIMFYEIPLFAILKHYPYFMVLVMSGLLWVAIYTTAAAGVFGLTTRFRKYLSVPLWALALFLVLSMIPLTTIGFSTLIGVLYPIYGILNLYILAAILIYPLLNKYPDANL